ncbi:hypothetical protein LPTSP4_23920 [Leptospira ryugenii]|uniref:Rad50/SbcC-type AAA domain-containing protein n=1 Tax=Leptospira ryugenii TaxID=1917863 RepID=A0A2P2E1T7_9LEPT|nr:AAA family ATPase [Leptospira ryugenii]GBF50865.1 hypothetical protein LPTSP4_23920 [Leptospira ryugenii]
MKLILDRFGKFKNSSFELKQVSIFSGANESGKTTLFDAFVFSLIKVKGATKYGRILSERYGKDVKAALQTTEPIEINPTNFLNTFAIREGRVALELSEQKEITEFFEIIRNSLFHDGFDPLKLVKLCADKAKTNGSGATAKEFRRLSQELEIKTKEYQTALEERVSMFSAWEEIPKWEEEKSQYEKKIKEINEQLHALNEDYKILNKKDSFRKLAELSEKSNYLLSHREVHESFRSFMETGKDKLTFEKADLLKEGKAKLVSLGDSILNQKKLFAQLEDEKNERQAKLSKTEVHSALATEIEAKVLDSIANTPNQIKSTWNTKYIFTSLLLFVIGSISSYFLANRGLEPWITFLPFVVSAISSIALFLWRGKTVTVIKDEGALLSSLASLSDALQIRSENTIVPILKTKEGIFAAIKNFRDAKNEQTSEINHLDNELKKMRTKLNELELEHSELLLQIPILENEVLSLCQMIGLKHFDQFQEKINEIKINHRKYQEIEASLAKEFPSFQVSDFVSLQRKVEASLQVLKEDSIVEEIQANESIRLAQIPNEIQKLGKVKEGLVGDLQILVERLATKKGSSQEKMQSALKREEDSLKSKLQVDADWLEFQEKLKAYQNLEQIFSEIKGSSNQEMQILVTSLQKRWQETLPKAELRAIDWNQLTENPKTEDAQKDIREVHQLSTGTRDLFYFTLRLEYAYRISKDLSIPWLLLDEPFRHLDKERLETSVQYLMRFIQETGWNLVVFTFDEDLKSMIEKNAETHKIPCIPHRLA